MYAANESGPSVRPSGLNDENRQNPGMRYALAGLQAGVLGALVMLACLMTGALWNGRSAWVVPNLFASTFFGSGAYRNQLLRTSWIGIALIIAVYGGLGAVWGCIWRGERRRWLGLYGAVFGLGVYLVFYGFLWRHVNPLVTLYAPDRQLQLGHLLWGMVLARSPLYARRIAGSTTAQAVHDDIAGQELRSGGVIR